MDLDDAIYAANVTVSQWLQFIKEGGNVEEVRAVLQGDMETLKRCLDVITDDRINGDKWRE